ncbi:hypothetical protein [Halalkalibacter wakoensis]|uniref:hypothetical protein n=1 Tax=Halalkalibacter wakoensis TaxID=127891 RepID=UPI000A727878
MNKQYILSIDQSTSGTKALLVDEQGMIIQKKHLVISSTIRKVDGWNMTRLKFMKM